MEWFLTDGTAWAALVGAFMPIIISMVKTIGVEKWQRAAIAFAVCVAAATGTAYFSGEWNTASIMVKIATVLVAAQTLYNSVWKPGGGDDKVWAWTIKTTARIPLDARLSLWKTLDWGSTLATPAMPSSTSTTTILPKYG